MTHDMWGKRTCPKLRSGDTHTAVTADTGFAVNVFFLLSIFFYYYYYLIYFDSEHSIVSRAHIQVTLSESDTVSNISIIILTLNFIYLLCGIFVNMII